MARIHVELVDDIGGSPATETMVFGLEGQLYEIDLSIGRHASLDWLDLCVDTVREAHC